MTLDDALTCLGTKRVIWIDDHFNDTPDTLAKLLLQGAETTRECGFAPLAGALAIVDEDPDEANIQAIEALAAMSKEEMTAVRTAFLKKEQELGGAAYLEMTVENVERTCQLLAIAPADRWPFEGAQPKLAAVKEAGDEEVAYIVDLREGSGPGSDEFRGLEILKLLGGMESKATAFILTHEANIEEEAQQEVILQRRLNAEKAVDIPLCVISKERLKGDETTVAEMTEALRVAIKRAGLRRSVHEVLRKAQAKVAEICTAAADGLLQVSPEHLDDHVVKVGYNEGMSELHVIERVLTAHIAQGLRGMFGTDADVRKSNDRLRKLRAIPLKLKPAALDEALVSFHKAEVWEEADLLNAAHAPIACGEIFRSDPEEAATAEGARLFVLLAQPCDIALRPNGKRAVETGVLIPFQTFDDPDKQGTEKNYKLPVMIDGKAYFCMLREAVPVRLSILDLASYRSDGRVRIDSEHESAEGLLPGLAQAHPARTKPFLALMKAANEAAAKAAAAVAAAAGKTTAAKIAAAEQAERKAVFDAAAEELQLLLAAPKPFKHVRRGVYEPAVTVVVDGEADKTTKERVTWRLQRAGRIRMPYAADLLDRYVGTINKPAFDVDYIARGQEASATAPAAAP